MILVTGSSGFIGKNLILSLLQRNEEVVGIDIMPTYYHPNLKEISIDITNPEIFTILNSYEFDKIVHTAAIASLKKSQEDPVLTYKTNIIGTLNLLEIARKRDIKKFIYISTAGIYKNSSINTIVNENWDINPSGFYTISKITSEFTVAEYAKNYGFSAAALRITAPYGPFMIPPNTKLSSSFLGGINRHTLLFAYHVIKGIDIIMPYGGDHTINYTYVGDIVEGIIRSLEVSFNGFEPFNITSGKAFTIRELAYAFSTLNPSIKVNIGPGTLLNSTEYSNPLLAPLPIIQGTFDISKAEKILGYKPKFSLQEGIEKLVDYMKNKIE